MFHIASRHRRSRSRRATAPNPKDAETFSIGRRNVGGPWRFFQPCGSADAQGIISFYDDIRG